MPPSKFDEEMTSAMNTGQNAISTLKSSIVENAPPSVSKPIFDVLMDDRTPVFLLGMGFEAAGIAIQYALGFPAYPILDAIVAITLMGIIIWYQRRQHA